MKRYKITLTCRNGHETNCVINEDLKLHIEHCYLLPVDIGYCSMTMNCCEPLSVCSAMVKNLKEVI